MLKTQFFLKTILLLGIAFLTTSILTLGRARAVLADDPIYVDHDATGVKNGTSWSNAYTDLQDALEAANDTPGDDEIWVAEGVYVPTNYYNDQSAFFQLANGVAIYGGFVGIESSRDQRDWVTHVTVLSGDLDGNDHTDANGVVTDTANIVGDNIRHIVRGSDTDATAILDGFVITAGWAGGLAASAGGGMYNSDGNPTLLNITFSANYASVSGGGMYNSSSNPTLTNVFFRNNYTNNYGGGMYGHNSSPTLTNVVFSGNHANDSGGGMLNNSYSSPALTNVIFRGNSADFGGGMYNSNSSPTLTNVTFSGNHANTYGGGMYNYPFCTPTLTNVTLSGNHADNSGGGIYNDGRGTPVLINCIVWGNTADTYPQIRDDFESYSTISYSLVEGGCPSESICDANLLDDDPQFARDPTSGDGDWSTRGDNDYGNLRLLSDSPAIDAGNSLSVTVPTDLAGNSRIIGDAVDMGAYEYKPVTILPPTITKTVVPTGTINYGDELTYTLVISAVPSTQVGLHDQLTGMTFVRFVGPSTGITCTDGVVMGTFAVTPTNQMTVSFVTQVGVPGTMGMVADVTNQACVYLLGGTLGDCAWSNEVTNYAFRPYDIYLPVLLRNR